MSTTCFSKKTLQYLEELKANNNRDWFAENKHRYLDAHEEMKAFADTLLNKMSLHDEIESIRPYRIYRDVRFSKDKLPYKNNLGCGMKRATKWNRGGYYFNIEPGNNFVAGGFWGPNAEDLNRIRREIAHDHKPLQKIINSAAFKKVFGLLEGEQVKTAPKGFPKDHKAIELLRYKQFLLRHEFTDQQVTTEGFVNDLSKTFKAMRPFLGYMSEVLTTDGNGTPI